MDNDADGSDRAFHNLGSPFLLGQLLDRVEKLEALDERVAVTPERSRNRLPPETDARRLVVEVARLIASPYSPEVRSLVTAFLEILEQALGLTGGGRVPAEAVLALVYPAMAESSITPSFRSSLHHPPGQTTEVLTLYTLDSIIVEFGEASSPRADSAEVIEQADHALWRTTTILALGYASLVQQLVDVCLGRAGFVISPPA